mmetsp:Transcript_6852/g.15912  ORF Transcript_6852/g.15912 Transcript_6852/m.15912 type:complete len:264 (-) Transcript_6852:311-1102(-)
MLNFSPERSTPSIWQLAKSSSRPEIPPNSVAAENTQPSHSKISMTAFVKLVPWKLLPPMKIVAVIDAPESIAASKMAPMDSPVSRSTALSMLAAINFALVMPKRSVSLLCFMVASVNSAPDSDKGPANLAPSSCAPVKLAWSSAAIRKVAPARLAVLSCAPVMSIVSNVVPAKFMPRKSAPIRSAHSGVAATILFGCSIEAHGCGGGGGGAGGSGKRAGGDIAQLGLPDCATPPLCRTLFVKQKEPSTGTTCVTSSLCISHRE